MLISKGEGRERRKAGEGKRGEGGGREGGERRKRKRRKKEGGREINTQTLHTCFMLVVTVISNHTLLLSSEKGRGRREKEGGGEGGRGWRAIYTVTSHDVIILTADM